MNILTVVAITRLWFGKTPKNLDVASTLMPEQSFVSMLTQRLILGTRGQELAILMGTGTHVASLRTISNAGKSQMHVHVVIPKRVQVVAAVTVAVAVVVVVAEVAATVAVAVVVVAEVAAVEVAVVSVVSAVAVLGVGGKSVSTAAFASWRMNAMQN